MKWIKGLVVIDLKCNSVLNEYKVTRRSQHKEWVWNIGFAFCNNRSKKQFSAQ